MIDLGPIQRAIYEALTAEPREYAVFDAVPQSDGIIDVTRMPYVVIGAFSGMWDEQLEGPSIDGTVTIHSWSAHAGKAQLHDMQTFTRQRLNALAGQAGIWGINEDFLDASEDPGSTEFQRIQHGVQRWRIRAESPPWAA